MKKVPLLLALLSINWAVLAQNPVYQNVIFVGSAPSGPCTNGVPAQIVINTGNMYTCQASVWAVASGSGGSGTVTHTAGSLSSNAVAVGNSGADIKTGDFSNVPASNLMDSSTSSSTNIVYSAGLDASNSGSGGVVTVRGANQTGSGSFPGAVAGGSLLTGGSNASSSATSQSGSVELTPGYSTNGGQMGVVIIGQAFHQGTGTHTQWSLQCADVTNPQTADDCAANPPSILGVTDDHTGSVVQTHVPPSITPVLASAPVTLGHTVCAGSTSGLVTDSGGTSPCAGTAGITIGVVIAVSGAWTLADGASSTITTTLPLVLMRSMQQVGSGDVAGGATHTCSTAITALTVVNGIITSITCP